VYIAVGIREDGSQDVYHCSNRIGLCILTVILTLTEHVLDSKPMFST